MALGEKVVIEREAIEELIRLILDEVKGSALEIQTSNFIPGTSEEANDSDMAKKIPTVLAVFNAMKSIDHLRLKFVKSKNGKTFKQMMEGVTPSEVTFYVFKDSANDQNFDLYLYDAQQGDYISVASSLTVSLPGTAGSDIDFGNFWTKDDFAISDYIKRDELEDLLKEYEGISKDLEGYLKKEEADEIYLKIEDLEVITATEVRNMFDKVKGNN